MRRMMIAAILMIAMWSWLGDDRTVAEILSDGFDFPVGITKAADERGTGYHIERGTRFGENNHLGEDWNVGSGDDDRGQPVYSISNGVVTWAEESGTGWGNVVIIRHTIFGREQSVNSLYGHLETIDASASVDKEVTRGQQIGTIG